MYNCSSAAFVLFTGQSLVFLSFAVLRIRNFVIVFYACVSLWRKSNESKLPSNESEYFGCRFIQQLVTYRLDQGHHDLLIDGVQMLLSPSRVDSAKFPDVPYFTDLIRRRHS